MKICLRRQLSKFDATVRTSRNPTPQKTEINPFQTGPAIPKFCFQLTKLGFLQPQTYDPEIFSRFLKIANAAILFLKSSREMFLISVKSYFLMKLLNKSPIKCVALLLCCLSCYANAALLSVDFAAAAAPDPGNPLQPGFQEWVMGSASDTAPPVTNPTKSFSTSAGSIVATIAGGSSIAAFSGIGNIQINTRARAGIANSGDFTQSALLNERFVSTGSPTNVATPSGIGNGLYLRLTGLAASTTYTIQVWGVDYTAGALKSGYFHLFDATNEGAGYTSLPSLGSYSIGSTPSSGGASSGITTISNNNQYSVTANVTTDSTGTLIVKSISNIDGSGIMNGFVLIPEPSSAVLLFGAMGGLVLLRRRSH